MGYNVSADYGRDVVGFRTQGSHDPTVADQLVGGNPTKTFYLGLVGLNPRSTNFSNNVPSFLNSLKDNGHIPSLSYGYTAGTGHEQPFTVGSLVLGGHDQSRYVQNSVTFPISGNANRPLSLNLHSLTIQADSVQPGLLPNRRGNITNLLEKKILVDIDSTVPYLWLPEPQCNQIAEILGLHYNETSGFYYTRDNRTLRANSTITFQFGNDNETLDMVVPFGSFDISGFRDSNFPMSRYVALRRSQDTFSLGRAFLQSVYVIADHERGNFSIHQAVRKAVASSSGIVAIRPLDFAETEGKGKAGDPPLTTPPSKPSHKQNYAMIGGISGGSFAVVALVAMIWFYWRRRRSTRANTNLPESSQGLPWDKPMLHGKELHELECPNGVDIDGTPQAEIDGKPCLEVEGILSEEAEKIPIAEIEGTPRAEMDGTTCIVGKEADNVDSGTDGEKY